LTKDRRWQFVSDQGRTSIEPSAEAKWVQHHNEVARETLVFKTNVPGKERQLLPYAGGVGTYRDKCNEVKARGYEGFITA
jgi:acetone monooxygenase